MSDKNSSIFTLTIPVILAHPALFEAKPFTDPRTGKPKGEPKFGANFVFEPDSEDLKSMKALTAKLAKAARPDIDLKTIKTPFSNGTVLADKRKAKLGDKYTGDAEFQRGKVVIAARSKYQPVLSLLGTLALPIHKGKVVNGVLTLDDPELLKTYKDKFFFGAKVLGEINLVWYDEVNNGQPGVTAYLNQVFACGGGTRISGRRSGAEAFSGYVGSVSAEDPTAGSDWSGEVDDEIPF
ncbi:MAG: ssDNA-binding protein [Reyranella sp.]|uniref:ssDNA-binding protein n=1 Tax=Reyranella sp. TaxID=1929291 RepID=UPI003D0F3521